MILREVTGQEHVYWCRQCHSDACKDDVEDERAWRNPLGVDKELSTNQ